MVTILTNTPGWLAALCSSDMSNNRISVQAEIKKPSNLKMLALTVAKNVQEKSIWTRKDDMITSTGLFSDNLNYKSFWANGVLRSLV